MKRKIVAVFFGGRSGEHVVSLRSAASIMKAIDPEKYDIVPVGITREGAWITGDDAWLSLWEKRQPRNAYPAAMLTDPKKPGLLVQSSDSPLEWNYRPLDLAFPVLHGTYGEDGTIQGLFEMAGLPYVGSGVLASSTGMDKVVMKILFREFDLPVAPYIYFYRWQWVGRESYWVEKCGSELNYPCFVKPSNLGSSVGISKARSSEELRRAIDESLLYDDKVIIESYIDGREIECSVLGDTDAEASRPGEVIPCNEFYDYRAKYIDDHSELVIPVELKPDVESLIKTYSVKAFKAVEASGLARVDFFLSRDGSTVMINEINTLPGFTSISMYPKLWEASGVSYNELVNRLLELAEVRHLRRSSLLAAPPE
ncbi:MAG: D-alanine--D-alanine ligase family protein [Dethiobacteria bacterium]